MPQHRVQLVQRPSTPHAAGGFTLIELLVVVIIISLTVTLATLNLQRDADHIASLEANRIASLMEHVREEAIITARPMAMEFDEAAHAYSFLRQDDGWQAVEGDAALRRRTLAEPVTFRFERLDVPREQEGMLVVFGSTGEVSPFRLEVLGEDRVYRLFVNETDSIVVSEAAREAA
jgi:general secretion pathway protein H